MTEAPLDGLKVIDLTRVLAGPLCAMLLGDLGADVIKVERPDRGDDTRGWGPPFAGGESAYYLHVNRNKRSLTLNLNAEIGRSILAELITSSDVVLENFKLGTLPKWGFDESWFQEHAPHVVRCTVSGYGSTGPGAGIPGYDFIAQAESGLMAITGEPDGDPMKLGVAIVDYCAGLMAAISILAALQSREQTGRGQNTEVSLHDTGLQMLAAIASNHLISGEPAVRYGNGHPNLVPYRTFTAADGSFALAIGNDTQFRAMCDIVGRPDWADDPRFARNQDRVVNRDTIEALISEVLISGRKAEWISVFRAAGIPCGPVRSVVEALSDPLVAAREVVTEIDHPTIGRMSMLGLSLRLNDTPAEIRRHPPLLGEHTEEILVGLGYDEAEVKTMRESGVV
ncbi:MAG: CoA transferase [Actinobacteria bacterium]|nr:CoA transferase [Actinomycetota bacterium]